MMVASVLVADQMTPEQQHNDGSIGCGGRSMMVVSVVVADQKTPEQQHNDGGIGCGGRSNDSGAAAQ